jgi:hypothetical protein
MNNDELITYPEPTIIDMTDILNLVGKRCIENRMTPTDKSRVKTRKGSGNKMFKYVTWLDVVGELDKKYPGWSLEVIPESINSTADVISIAVKLTVHEPEGIKRVITAYGSDEAIINKETGKLVSATYMKNAETDALKRAAARLGMFNDVYTDENVNSIFSEDIDDSSKEWFIENVMPVLSHDSARLYKVIIAFNNGVIDKQYIIENILKGK